MKLTVFWAFGLSGLDIQNRDSGISRKPSHFQDLNLGLVLVCTEPQNFFL